MSTLSPRANEVNQADVVKDAEDNEQYTEHRQDDLVYRKEHRVRVCATSYAEQWQKAECGHEEDGDDPVPRELSLRPVD